MHNGSQILAILQLQNRISTPKRRNGDFEARFKRKKEKHQCQINKFAAKAPQLSCSHYNAIYDSQLLNAIELRMQLPQGATLTQPFHSDLQTLHYKTQ